MADPRIPQEPPGAGWCSRAGIAFVVLLGVALFFLIAEHRAHLLGAWPYLLLLACPLMHLLHHGGHGRGGHAGHGQPPAQREPGRQP